MTPLYYTPRVTAVVDLKHSKQALISDPASDATDVASTCASIIDVLQAYQMVATA